MAQRVLRVLDAAGGSQRRGLGGVRQAHPQLVAVTEVGADVGGEELQGDHGLVDPVPSQQPQHMLHDRPVDDGEQRFGLVGRYRAQPGPLPARHDDGSHRPTSASSRPASSGCPGSPRGRSGGRGPRAARTSRRNCTP